jgi:hypothetical protein
MDLLCTAVSLHDGYLIQAFTSNEGEGAWCKPMLVRRANYEECKWKKNSVVLHNICVSNTMHNLQCVSWRVHCVACVDENCKLHGMNN